MLMITIILVGPGAVVAMAVAGYLLEYECNPLS